VKNPILAVDIGGTKVAAGLVDRSGRILVTKRAPMAARGSSDEGLAAVFAALHAVLRDRRARRARAIGVSVPGWIDTRRGVVLSAPNITCWQNLPLRREIENRYDLPVRIANDANAGALAEAKFGSATGAKISFYVTLGTGIGTGLVINGRIYSGMAGGATEGGHVSIDLHGPVCGCGKRGCIEMYASGTAVGRRARDLVTERDPNGSQMLDLAGGEIDKINAHIVSQAATSGDSLAREILHGAADALGIWLGGMIDLLEPGVIVLGGGFSAVMMPLLPRVREKLKVWASNPRRDEIPIISARYGAESALVGAAALCIKR